MTTVNGVVLSSKATEIMRYLKYIAGTKEDKAKHLIDTDRTAAQIANDLNMETKVVNGVVTGLQRAKLVERVKIANSDRKAIRLTKTGEKLQLDD